jgi:conjugal transfer pilus assembly protein TraE|tara:strand:+ start:7497 stop:8063 length:567 start_codon:yes stop_codon:yes gene_type:complete
MDLTSATGRVRSISRVTVILTLFAGALAVTCTVLGVVVLNQRSEVVLVPTLTTEMTISSGTPSGAYLEAMTRDVAGLFLNRHPHNTDYFRENILRIVHSSVYAELQRDLAVQREERVRTRTSTVFHPLSIYVDPEDHYSEITGIVKTYVGSNQVSEETKVFAATWIVEGLSVRLADFSEIDNANSRAR